MFAELSNYLDEKLDDSVCEELEKHLGDCEPCQAFVTTLQATIEALRQIPAPNSATATKLRKELVQQYERAVAQVSG